MALFYILDGSAYTATSQLIEINQKRMQICKILHYLYLLCITLYCGTELFFLAENFEYFWLKFIGLGIMLAATFIMVLDMNFHYVSIDLSEDLIIEFCKIVGGFLWGFSFLLFVIYGLCYIESEDMKTEEPFPYIENVLNRTKSNVTYEYRIYNNSDFLK